MNDPTKVFGRRILALLIDSLVYAAVYTPLFFLLADKKSDIESELALGETRTTFVNITLGDEQYSVVGGEAAIFFLLTTLFSILYYWVLPGLIGWTLGKLATGIRVVREDGTCPAGVGRNALRGILWIVDAFPYFLPLVGPIVALADNRRQRVGDKVAKTLVVRADAVGQQAGAFAGAGAGAAPGAGVLPGGSPGPGEPFAPTPQPAQPAHPPAGWYPDPHGQAAQRYWDGNAWTEHTA